MSIPRKNGARLGWLVLLAAVVRASTLYAGALYYDNPATINTDLGNNNVVVGQNSTTPFTLTIANGANILSDTNAPPANGHWTDGGLVTYNNAAVNVTGGSIYIVNSYNNSSIVYGSGVNVTSYCWYQGNSRITANGGTFAGVPHFMNSSTGTLNAGAFQSGLMAQDTATLTLHNVQAPFTQGQSNGWYLDGGSHASIDGGIIPYAWLNYNDPQIYSAPRPSFYGKAVLDVSGTAQIQKGIWGSLGATVNINGGVIGPNVGPGSPPYANLILTQSSTGNIRGGQFTAAGGSMPNDKGVLYNLGGTSSTTPTVLNVYGTDLSLTPIGGPTTWPPFNVTGQYYNLTGTLQDGESIDCYYFGGLNYPSATTYSQINLISVPEPGTALLLGLGAAAWLCRRPTRRPRGA